MKKTISINISGIIFHIEDDGYDTLRKYLDSINKYFGSFEDSSEILADIESRIAEIFLSKLNEGKQVINSEDVASLIATMGNVSDFKAAEEQEFANAGTKEESTYSQATTPHKKLVRDQKRKILGGVCAGLAHYFSIDSVWPRLIFALLTLGYGGGILLYIILWIVLPGVDNLEEEETVKKMYRNPDHKVLGGVAGGIAAFFGADVVLVRVLFAILLFFAGFGAVLYIILWISLPEARTITERMQMQGEPVTLSNIESTVKRGLNEKDQPEESPLTKVVLFPFRALAAILNVLAKIIRPIFDVIRILCGGVITITALAIMLSLIVALGLFIGMFSSASLPEVFHLQFFNEAFPVDAFRNIFPTWTVVFAFLVAFIPALFIMLVGNSIMAKRLTFGPMVGWSLFVLFFVSILVVSFNIPRMIYAFKEDGEYKVENVYSFHGKKGVLRLRESGLDDYDVTSLTLKGYDGKDFKLVEHFEAQGNTRKVAADNAQMVEYRVEQQDSVLLFDSNITFKKGAQFRAQRLKMDLYVPYDQPFVVEKDIWHLVDNNRLDRYTDSDDDTQTWRITQHGLECVTCYDSHHDERSSSETVPNAYDLVDFNAIDLSGIFQVEIEKRDQFGVELKGEPKLKERYDVYKDGETLVISYDSDNKLFWKKGFWNDQDELKIIISLPNLKDLEVKGAGKVKFSGFEEDEVKIKFTGAVSGEGDIQANDLDVDLTGASSLELRGHGEKLEASVTGASNLKAYNYEVRNATVTAHGASNAKVNATETLEIDKGIASSVTHRGNPEVTKNY